MEDRGNRPGSAAAQIADDKPTVEKFYPHPEERVAAKTAGLAGLAKSGADAFRGALSDAQRVNTDPELLARLWRFHNPAKTKPADFSTPDLIMELLARGYVVMKAPDGGGFPETLR